MKLSQNLDLIIFYHLQKTASQNLYWFSRYSPATLTLAGGPSMDQTRKIFGRIFFCSFGIYKLQFPKKCNKKFFDRFCTLVVWHLKIFWPFGSQIPTRAISGNLGKSDGNYSLHIKSSDLHQTNKETQIQT